MNDRQTIEVFHLLFLDWLGRKLDKASYALKGGCNLRFFFRSIRYSEDMDLDAGADAPVHLLRDRVNGILRGQPFRQTLLARGIEIEHITESKQPDTVQRWKLGLLTGTAERPLPTKIEFSRRGLGAGVRFEHVDPSVTGPYRLAPVLTNHYDAVAATRQKIEALRSRKAPQARDVFDLHLLRSAGVDLGRVAREAGLSPADLQSRVMDFTPAMFVGQVLAYLPAEEQERYAAPRLWDAMVLNVASALQEAPP
jgi:hypothetical protein